MAEQDHLNRRQKGASEHRRPRLSAPPASNNYRRGRIVATGKALGCGQAETHESEKDDEKSESAPECCGISRRKPTITLATIQLLDRPKNTGGPRRVMVAVTQPSKGDDSSVFISPRRTAARKCVSSLSKGQCFWLESCSPRLCRESGTKASWPIVIEGSGSRSTVRPPHEEHIMRNERRMKLKTLRQIRYRVSLIPERSTPDRRTKTHAARIVSCRPCGMPTFFYGGDFPKAPRAHPDRWPPPRFGRNTERCANRTRPSAIVPSGSGGAVRATACRSTAAFRAAREARSALLSPMFLANDFAVIAAALIARTAHTLSGGPILSPRSGRRCPSIPLISGFRSAPRPARRYWPTSRRVTRRR